MANPLALSGQPRAETSARAKRAQTDSSLHRPTWYDFWKTCLEFVGALLMLVIAAPVILLAAVLVRCSSRGPAFYTQTRLGRDRRNYTIYKLRSMRHDCEKHTGPCWSSSGDARVTPVGRFLRRTHIDEL